jgi:hypothetical protein
MSQRILRLAEGRYHRGNKTRNRRRRPIVRQGERITMSDAYGTRAAARSGHLDSYSQRLPSAALVVTIEGPFDTLFVITCRTCDPSRDTSDMSRVIMELPVAFLTLS